MVEREAVGAVVRRPSLWLEAVRLARASSSPGTVVPDDAYTAWRLETAYGDRDHPLDGDDLVELLRWRRRQRKLSR